MVKPIEQKKVVDAVFTEMMNHILSGEWAIGSKIPSENELSKELNVSRNSLRQALNRFNALGIIEPRHGDGSYVRAVDMAFYLQNIFPMVILSHYDALNVYQLQRAIQNEAANYVCDNVSEEDIAALEAQLAAMKQADDEDDAASYLEADMRYHEIFAEITHNPVLISMEQCINKIIHGPLYKISYGSVREGSILMHAKIIEGMKRRDSRSVSTWMAVHMDDVVSHLQEQPCGEDEDAASDKK